MLSDEIMSAFQDLLPDGRARFGVNGHDVVACRKIAHMDAAFGVSPADALYELPACAEYRHAADSFAAIHGNIVFCRVGVESKIARIYSLDSCRFYSKYKFAKYGFYRQ